MPEPVSRFEFDALVHRVETMDQRGTSGAGAVEARLEAAERELANMRAQLEDERKERRANRRWIIAAIIAAAAAASSIASVILTYVFHAH
jgi:fatty acid desaturase